MSGKPVHGSPRSPRLNQLEEPGAWTTTSPRLSSSAADGTRLSPPALGRSHWRRPHSYHRVELETFGATLEREPSAAGEAMRALLEARVCLAEDGDPSAVRDRSLRSYGSPWLLLKCLRLLIERDIAEVTELAEARALEERLGIPPRT